MPARPPTIVVIYALALFVAGCGVQPGQKVLTYNSAGTELPKPKAANRDGMYGLYPDDGLTPVEKVELHAGQAYGFRRSSDGRIVGFAGDREYSLTAVLATEYSWKYLGKDSQK